MQLLSRLWQKYGQKCSYLLNYVIYWIWTTSNLQFTGPTQLVNQKQNKTGKLTYLHWCKCGWAQSTNWTQAQLCQYWPFLKTLATITDIVGPGHQPATSWPHVILSKAPAGPQHWKMLQNICDSVYSIYPFLLWCLWEYIYLILISPSNRKYDPFVIV